MAMVSAEGSSPRMRGALLRYLGRSWAWGIIPADAGSTINGAKYSLGTQGSSPRMRGALIIRRGDETGVGIIPADAGSTRWRAPGQYQTADHPRGCGEHWFSAPQYREGRGSSPRMRGARGRGHGLFPRPRIIPADAGSTIGDIMTDQTLKDHPRGCGEHQVNKALEANKQGSSPRMRGAQVPHRLPEPPQGIIPADAGSTPSSVITS